MNNPAFTHHRVCPLQTRKAKRPSRIIAREAARRLSANKGTDYA